MSESMDRRERAAGLYLAGNDPLSGRIGEDDLFPAATPLTGQGDPVDLVMDNDGVDTWEPPHEEDQHPYGGRGGGGGGGEGIYEDDQDFVPGGPFAITINGTTSIDNSGNTVQTSPFTIDCNGGTGTYPAQGTGTTPQPVNFSSSAGIQATPSISGVTSWRVYAKVGATITDNGIDVNANGTIHIVEVADTTDLVGSNTRYKPTSFTTYDFYFLIGSVDAKRQTLGGQYNVKVTQIQNGNYSYGNVESTTATAGGATVSTKDGLRRFTININGELFTCEIDVSNIHKR